LRTSSTTGGDSGKRTSAVSTRGTNRDRNRRVSALGFPEEKGREGKPSLVKSPETKKKRNRRSVSGLKPKEVRGAGSFLEESTLHRSSRFKKKEEKKTEQRAATVLVKSVWLKGVWKKGVDKKEKVSRREKNLWKIGGAERMEVLSWKRKVDIRPIKTGGQRWQSRGC